MSEPVEIMYVGGPYDGFKYECYLGNTWLRRQVSNSAGEIIGYYHFAGPHVRVWLWMDMDDIAQERARMKKSIWELEERLGLV